LNLETIIKSCAKQNRQAQEELYNLYKKTLFVLCLKYCANQAEAEDNLHNAFIEIFTNIKKFDGKGSFEGWMKRITINKAINSYKKNYNLTPIKDDFEDEIYVDENEINCSLEEMLLMVQELPNRYRLVFSLYELDDYTHKEIAAMLSISENTSKSNLHRAKMILREKINAKNSMQKNVAKNEK